MKLRCTIPDNSLISCRATPETMLRQLVLRVTQDVRSLTAKLISVYDPKSRSGFVHLIDHNCTVSKALAVWCAAVISIITNDLTTYRVELIHNKVNSLQLSY